MPFDKTCGQMRLVVWTDGSPEHAKIYCANHLEQEITHIHYDDLRDLRYLIDRALEGK